jgi:phosphoglycerate kinase
MTKKSIRDINVTGKKVLVRVDYNVPIDSNTGVISDDSRIKASLPTIKYLIDCKARIILCSHLGRPDGVIIEKLRMNPIAEHLSHLLNKNIFTVPDCIGLTVHNAIEKLREGDILLLENLRFYPQEELNDDAFAHELAKLADVYVNDAFGTAHRAHASTVGVAKYLPAVAGFLMETELSVMSKLLNNPEHPFACVIGGAKISDKIGLMQNMMDKVDVMIIGGGMIATLLKAQGLNIGQSMVEDDKLDVAKDLFIRAGKQKTSLVLPTDVVVTENIQTSGQNYTVLTTEIPAKSYIVDIGPESIKLFSEQLMHCHTIMWNGPMGIYEIPKYARGTRAIAQFMANTKAITVVGGGSTVEAICAMGLEDKMSHVSTGGGASLQFLEGKTLPGVAVLQDK